MPIVVPLAGATLERVRETMHLTASTGLSRDACVKFDRAQMKTAWGRRHQRHFALVEGADVLASATVYDLAAILDQRPVRVCGIGEVLRASTQGEGHVIELIEQLLDQAAREGAAMALFFSDTSQKYTPPDFHVVPMTDLELTVAESSRHGAPMTLIRGGEERDLGAIAAMGQVRARPFRFHLDRDVDFVQYAITKKRLLAGLGSASARQLHFFIAEEGITAAAYVVVSIVGDTWTIEECGDRDPSGARLGAILQALIAREPGERRPTIRAWLPAGFIPPQITIRSATPSTEMMMVRFLETSVLQAPLTREDVLYWRGDTF